VGLGDITVGFLGEGEVSAGPASDGGTRWNFKKLDHRGFEVLTGGPKSFGDYEARVKAELSDRVSFGFRCLLVLRKLGYVVKALRMAVKETKSRVLVLVR